MEDKVGYRKEWAIVIMGLFLAISILAGCSRKTDSELRFEMEKLLTLADHDLEQAKNNSPKLETADIEKLLVAYSNIAKMVKLPKQVKDVERSNDNRRQLWALASLATTRVGNLYIESKQYDKAFESFKVVVDCPATTPLQRNALYGFMAMAKELSKAFPEAASYYDSLALGYLELIVPQSPNMDAMNAPLKSAEMWADAGNESYYLNSLKKAQDYYRAIMNKNNNTLIGAAAAGKLAASFLQQNSFTEAIAVLETVKDTTGYTAPNIMLMIADIYLNRMQDNQSAEKTYREFAAAYPKSKDIATAKFGLGLSLFAQKRFTEARKAVDGMEKISGATEKDVAQAIYLTALCFESEDKWELAKGKYDFVQVSYPGTEQSYEAALHIPNYFRNKGQSELAKRAFESSVAYITKLANQNKADETETAKAFGYLVRAYLDNNDNSKAAELLEQLHTKYPELPEGRLAPLRLADIYENTNHDTLKTIEWLKIFIAENPYSADRDKIQAHLNLLQSKSGGGKVK